MPETFQYKVKDKSGKVVQGSLEAENAQLVVSKLRSMGYVPIEIQQQGGSGFQRDLKIPFFTDRVKLKEVAVFSRQFATMINSGLSLLRSLNILAEQTESKTLAEIVNQVRIDVEKGSSLSQAMSKHPKAFGRLYVSMVRAGEIGGALDSVLMRLADTIEKQVELRRKVKSAMTYPLVVAVLVLTIVTAMLLFVIPMFQDIYKQLGGTLPPPTQLLINISNICRKFWYLIFLAEGGGAFAFRRWINSEEGRKQWDAIKLKLPIFGKLVRKTALARFSRTLSALVRSGVPILESLDIVAETAGNYVVAKAVRETQAAVKRGDPLSKKLEEHPVFPPMVVQMMAVGEETGALDEMLDKIADFYDQEVEATVDALTSLIEPLLIVVMGVCVGGMIISLYLPMFNIIKLIK
ncbi:MAG: type pilus assembly protein PilC [Actinomycetota bacterium]|jgi:type IV pilus assembly protein PilC|nr:type pilus assembly protein PilC [Actinomycetota bacterium]